MRLLLLLHAALRLAQRLRIRVPTLAHMKARSLKKAVVRLLLLPAHLQGGLSGGSLDTHSLDTYSLPLPALVYAVRIRKRYVRMSV